VRRKNIGRRTLNASRVYYLRNNETEEDRSQTLPVISRSTAAGEKKCLLEGIILWRCVKNLKSTTNQPVALQNDIS
jgi:hypothetical protein